MKQLNNIAITLHSRGSLTQPDLTIALPTIRSATHSRGGQARSDSWRVYGASHLKISVTYFVLNPLKVYGTLVFLNLKSGAGMCRKPKREKGNDESRVSTH